jgi:hypothetical protein
MGGGSIDRRERVRLDTARPVSSQMIPSPSSAMPSRSPASVHSPAARHALPVRHSAPRRAPYARLD